MWSLKFGWRVLHFLVFLCNQAAGSEQTYRGMWDWERDWLLQRRKEASPHPSAHSPVWDWGQWMGRNLLPSPVSLRDMREWEIGKLGPIQWAGYRSTAFLKTDCYRFHLLILIWQVGKEAQGSVLQGVCLTMSFLGMWEENVSPIKLKCKQAITFPCLWEHVSKEKEKDE